MKKVITSLYFKLPGNAFPTAISGVMKCLFILFLFIGCEDPHDWYIEDEFRTQVDSFFDEASKRGRNYIKMNLMVKFGDTKGCSGRASKKLGQRIVTISPNDWRMDYQNRTAGVHEFLIFHELGHALLRRMHCGGNSIMNPHCNAVNEYQNGDRERLLDELFRVTVANASTDQVPRQE